MKNRRLITNFAKNLREAILNCKISSHATLLHSALVVVARVLDWSRDYYDKHVRSTEIFCPLHCLAYYYLLAIRYVSNIKRFE